MPVANDPSLLSWFVENVNNVVAVLTALLWIVGLTLYGVTTTINYKLLRRTFADDPFGGFWNTLAILAGAASYRAREKLHSRAVGTFSECIRIRIEHEIFRGEHTLGTSDPFGDRVIGDPDTKREAWRKLTAGNVNKAFKRIETYFEVLEDLKAAGELKFVCKLTIETGFVAPLHLLAGLLSRFGDDWLKIVQAYNEDVTDDRQAPWVKGIRGSKSGAPVWITIFRKMQKFNFDCWLQWGPSIPNSTSEADDKFTSIQYGFGDENNSIELVADREDLEDQMRSLWASSTYRPMALPARVEGRITHSNVLAKSEKKLVSEVLKRSWGEDGRILLMPVGDAPIIYKPEAPAYYYSAYIWVMFVVMVQHRNGGPLQPLHPLSDEHPDQTSHPWLDLFPFFEHCNIGCPAALLLIKQQLALKAVSGIDRIFKEAEGNPFPLRFVFTCAIDDPGDGGMLWLDKLKKPDDRHQDLLTLMAALEPKFPHLFDKHDPIIKLDHYRELRLEDRPFTTHKLVDHVNKVLVRVSNAQDSVKL